MSFGHFQSDFTSQRIMFIYFHFEQMTKLYKPSTALVRCDANVERLTKTKLTSNLKWNRSDEGKTRLLPKLNYLYYTFITNWIQETIHKYGNKQHLIKSHSSTGIYLNFNLFLQYLTTKIQKEWSYHLYPIVTRQFIIIWMPFASFL